MLDDLFIPTPAANSTTNQIANCAFVGVAIASAVGFATVGGLNLLANSSTGTAAVAGVSLSSYLDVAIGSASGSLIARDATTWGPLLPDWAAYTPTITAGTGTFTSVAGTGRYKQVGKTVNLHVDITITTNGTAANSVRATLPINQPGNPTFYGRAAIANKQCVGFAVTTSVLGITFYDGTYPGASGETIRMDGAYESV